jgi:hypothetical protein
LKRIKVKITSKSIFIYHTSMATNAIVEPSYKALCSKDGVVLKYKRYTSDDAALNPQLKNTFLIDFEVCNSSVTMERFCNYNIFRLIYEVNRNDAIETLILDEDEFGSADMTLIFKRKGEDFGMKQKYMSLNIKLTESGTNYVFEGETIYKNRTGIDFGNIIGKDAEQIQDATAVFCISLLSSEKMRVQFMLSVPVPKIEQPSYLEHNLGMIMKKVLSRTKLFIENMK